MRKKSTKKAKSVVKSGMSKGTMRSLKKLQKMANNLSVQVSKLIEKGN